MQQGNIPVLYCEPPLVQQTFRPSSPRLTVRHSSHPISIQFSNSGRLLASLNDRVQLRSLITWKLIRSLKISKYTPMKELTYSPDSREIAFGDDPFEIIIWSTITGQSKHGHDPNIKDHNKSYKTITLDYSPCGKQIVVGNKEGMISMWNSQICSKLDVFNSNHRAAVICIRFSPNGQQIVSASGDETIQILDAKSLQQKLNIQCHNYFAAYSFVSCVGYSIDNREIISIIEGAIKIWDADSGKARIFRKDQQKIISKFSMSKNDKWMLYTAKNFFGICDFQTRSVLGEIKLSALISSCAYDKNRPQIALGCKDGVLRLYRTDRI